MGSEKEFITMEGAKVLFFEMLDIYEEKKVAPRHAAHVAAQREQAAAQKETDTKVDKILGIIDRSMGWKDAVKTCMAAIGVAASAVAIWKVIHG